MLEVAVVRFPGSNCDLDAVRAAEARRRACLSGLASRHRPARRRRRDPARRVQLRRLPPVRRHRPIQPDHAGGPAARRRGRRRCWGSATDSRSSARRTCCPAPCCGTRASPSSPSRWTSWSSAPTTVFTSAYAQGDRLRMPVAHGEGRYVATDDTLRLLEAEGRVVLRYVSATEDSPLQPNPNGSANHIAGICNAAGTVVGIMPHPERAADPTRGMHRRARVLHLHGGPPAPVSTSESVQPMSTDKPSRNEGGYFAQQNAELLAPATEPRGSGRPGGGAEDALHEVPEGRVRPDQHAVPRRADRDLPPLRRGVARRRRARRRSPTRNARRC